MELAKLHVLVTVTATLVGIIFLILNQLFSYSTSLWVSIELMLLPAIYIIGNLYAEKLIIDKSIKGLSFISRKFYELDQKYYKQVLLNERLRGKLRSEYEKNKDWQ